MIPNSLSASWDAIAPALGNHVWQSTFFAVAAGLLTLILRKHHARTRYWLWLAASVKFLIPFSLLTSFGSRLAWHPSAAATPGLYFTMEQIGQPFTLSPVNINSGAAASASSPSFIHLLPILIVLWLCGVFVVLFVWSVRWRRVTHALKAALPLSEGREVGALRRVERIGGLQKPIALLLSQSSLEPGIFGIARPVLIWPEGISKRLEDAHLEAILAHEVWHVRRRDNLFAALHMLVEAIFWFHPLVWWLGARLIEERERACDEEVVEFGSARQVYAESILKVCEFCLGSPLVCVSGVTGADLKRRMVHIMSDRRLHKLDFARKFLLSIAAFLAIAIPVTFGLLNAIPSRAQSEIAATSSAVPVFDSVSVRPYKMGEGLMRTQMMLSLSDGSFSAKGIPLQMLIHSAYNVQDSQITGGPDWLNSAKFDVDARLSDSSVAELSKLGKDQIDRDNPRRLQALLADRFKLQAHFETQNRPVYELVAVKNGPKLQETNAVRMLRLMGRGDLEAGGIPMSLLADELSRRLGATVVDKTRLKGNYIFHLKWTPDAAEDARFTDPGGPQGGPATAEASGPPLFTALEEQVGVKLEQHIQSVRVLVVDHAEPPTEN